MDPILSKAERKVYILCCKGLSNLEIAKALGLSINTVKTHMRVIFKKKQVKSRSTLIINHVKEQSEKEEELSL